MKNIIIVIACLLLAAACQKKEPAAPDYYAKYNGTVTAMRNGKVWKPLIGAFYTSKNMDSTFYIEVVDYRDDFEWDALSFNNIPPENGKYYLSDYFDWLKSKDSSGLALPAALYNGSFNEGSDVGGRNFMRTDRPHRITIDYYNPTTREVKGSFEVAFMRSDTSRSRQLGLLDTVTYTNAVFSAIIWRQEDLPRY